MRNTSTTMKALWNECPQNLTAQIRLLGQARDLVDLDISGTAVPPGVDCRCHTTWNLQPESALAARALGTRYS